MGETWAIVGSRGYGDLGAVRAFVRTLPNDSVVVSGGAQGVDQEAERAAAMSGLIVHSWRPIKVDGVWRVTVISTGPLTEGRSVHVFEQTFPTFPAAAFWRNGQLVEAADHVQAFWDRKSRGTADTVRKAKAAGKLAGLILWPPQIEELPSTQRR
jgi:hypothetical protein